MEVQLWPWKGLFFYKQGSWNLWCCLLLLVTLNTMEAVLVVGVQQSRTRGLLKKLGVGNFRVACNVLSQSLKIPVDKFHRIWLGDNLKLWQYIFGELVMIAIFLICDTVCTVIDTHTHKFCQFLCIFDSNPSWLTGLKAATNMTDNLFLVSMVITL